MANLTPRIRRAIELRELGELSTKETDILLRKQEWKFSRCRGEEALISERFMEDRTNLSAFPKHFDGKRFYNPDAPQALGFLDALRWKLTSRPEQSPIHLGRRADHTPFTS
jgi:hypothetical protein